jgi:methionine-S-sulfoxide reductase
MIRPHLLALSALGLAAFAPAADAQGARRLETAVFAGGCFWSIETGFEKIPGVVEAVSGFAGGRESNPTYKQVATERTEHLEAVKVTFDPAKVSYRTLVDRFWRNIDPTDDAGQFCDRGPSYRTAVFVASPEQRRTAEESKRAAGAALKRPVVTPIRDAARFWPAEAVHQDFAKRNPGRYEAYRIGCRRDARLKALWGR